MESPATGESATGDRAVLREGARKGRNLRTGLMRVVSKFDYGFAQVPGAWFWAVTGVAYGVA